MGGSTECRGSVQERSCESWPGTNLTGVKFDRCQVLECSCESWPGAKFDRCQV
jgi:hypothetical protein